MAAWGDGLDPEGQAFIVGRSPRPFVGRRGRLASLGAPEAKVLFGYAGIGASTFSYKGVDAASNVLHDVVEYYSVPDRMPGLLVCADHVRVIVGAIDAPLPRQLVFVDPNWPEPRFQTLDRGRLESLAPDLKFQMTFLDD